MRRILSSLIICLLSFSPAGAQDRAEVLLETTEGNIRIALYNETPLHRDNFLKLVEQHVYDSLLFHRVIRNFMIQAGDPKSRHAEPGAELGEGDLGYTIEPEFRLPAIYHRRGVVAAAREGDATNPQQRSSASQFYIVWGTTFSTAGIQSVQARLDSVTHHRVQLTPEQMDTYRKVGGTPHLDGQYTVFGEVVEGMDVVDRIQRTDTDDYNRPVYDVRIVKATVVKR